MRARLLELAATAADRGRRLDHFLVAHLPALSRSAIQELIKNGQVVAGGETLRRPSTRLRGQVRLRVELITQPPLRAEPEAIPLDILYEDDDFIAVNKPAGMVVHAGAGVTRGTVVNALLHRFGRLSSVGGPLRPGIVHRLDKNTSGVLLVARTDAAHRELAEQFRQRTLEKRYLVLVHGRLPRSQDTIALPVARDPKRRTRMTARRGVGRTALTRYRVLASAAGFTLVEALMLTGRTHQIRAHFSALGHPVVGDTLYGAPRSLRRGNQPLPTLNRNFLHAERIRFRHPRRGQQLEIIAPLPAELAQLLTELGLSPPNPRQTD